METLAELLQKQAKMAAEMEALAADIEVKRIEEIKILADAFVKKAQAAGYSVQEALDAVKPYLPTQGAAGATRAKRGTASAEERSSVDTTGARPEKGVSYKLADGTVWIKHISGKGAPKKEFLAAMKDGATWASLKA